MFYVYICGLSPSVLDVYQIISTIIILIHKECPSPPLVPALLASVSMVQYVRQVQGQEEKKCF